MADINFFTGVPDSLLQDFNAYILNNVSKDKHIIEANEGGAIAVAAGYYLATEKLALVYMQNAGEGNAINPLTSLTDPEVYGIPMLLLIGWRGEPGISDEPQHVKQGKITLDLLDVLEIPYSIISNSTENIGEIIGFAKKTAIQGKKPYAIVVKKDTFSKCSLNNLKKKYELNREEAMKLIVSLLNDKDIIVSTTGKLSRELYEYRDFLNQSHRQDFLTVGAMGHSSQIALGISLAKSNSSVFCFDGDGAAIMHLGGFAIIGAQKPKNFKHIIFNNESHDSVGGQPTAASNIDFPKIAKACGYREAWQVSNIDEIKEKVALIKITEGPVLLEIKVNSGARDNLGRPKRSPIENKKDFMNFLKE